MPVDSSAERWRACCVHARSRSGGAGRADPDYTGLPIGIVNKTRFAGWLDKGRRSGRGYGLESRGVTKVVLRGLALNRSAAGMRSIHIPAPARDWGRLRKRKIKHAKPVAEVVVA